MHRQRVSMLGVVLSSWVAFVACGGTAPEKGTEGSLAMNQPPPGCKQTFCDYLRAACVDPPDACDRCLDTCDTVSWDVVLTCLNACDRICSRPTPSPCESDLAACRGTSKNSACADDVPFPRSTTASSGTGSVGATSGPGATTSSSSAGPTAGTSGATVAASTTSGRTTSGTTASTTAGAGGSSGTTSSGTTSSAVTSGAGGAGL